MRKLLLISLLSMTLPIFADTPPPAVVAANPAVAPKPLKIGVVDVRSVVQKSAQLQNINLQLTQKFKPREQAIVQAQARYREEEDSFNKDGPKLSEAQRTKAEHQIISDRANLQAMITAFQQDLDNEQNSAMQKLLSEIASIVNDTAKTQHYDLILQGDNVPYMTDQLNITDTVLRKLNG